jgi:beta-glucanase (GH16 family)
VVGALAAAAMAFGLLGLLGGGVTPQPIGMRGPWSLLFDAEFNGSSLDGTGFAINGLHGQGITAGVNSKELDCYDPRQVRVANGELDLSLIAKPESCGGRMQRYASGLVSTSGRFSYVHGYLEARVWLPGSGAIADWPTVWTVGQVWPADGEDDVVEGLGGAACFHFHDPRGGPGGCAPGTFTGRWHVFGADWEPGRVTYYYDAHRVGEITSGITSAPMYLIVNLATSGSTVAPAVLRVDYVRVWKRSG